MESLGRKRERAVEIYAILAERYPAARCTLDHASAFELIVATILAAQCTDERVNMVTPALFKKYPTAAKLAKADEEALREMIVSTGFFRNKAKSLLAMSKQLMERHAGEVPRTMEELTSLAGVGRKTANVVIANCFGGQAIIVDTHCKRLSARLGFTREADPDKIELDVQKVVGEDTWTMWSHLMVFHGRNICIARKPKCPDCPINHLCPSKARSKGGSLFP